MIGGVPPETLKGPVLVFDGELDPVVEGDGFFDAVVPASKLLGT